MNTQTRLPTNLLKLLLCMVPFVLSGCQTSSAPVAIDQDDDFALLLKEHWADNTHLILKSSQLPNAIQQIEIRLRTLPKLYSKVPCDRSELLEIKQKPSDTEIIETWIVKTCGRIDQTDAVPMRRK